jgi:hypothetical protein
MSAKALKIDSLDLDLENPRITLASDQRDAMQKIITEQKAKLINLAESIAVKGFSPMDRCLVLRSARAGKFIVLEGNRRVLAAKLLKNPSLLITLAMPDAFRKRLQKAAQNFDVKKVEPVDCYEVADRAEGNDWINQRHTGANEGRGIVNWSAIAVSRFRGRDPALQALDFVLQHGELTDEQKETIAGKFPLTTLDRLLSTPSVRTAIGLDITGGKLRTELPADEALKPLRRIVLDLAEKAVTVTHLKSKDQQNAYIAKLKGADKPDLGKKTGTSVTVEEITDKDFKPKSVSPAKKSRAGRTQARNYVVPKACKLNVSNAKILEIYTELRTLLLAKHPHAIAVLLRVFLETSVDHYLKAAAIPLTFPTSNGNKDKSLKKKVEETIDHLVANGASKKDFLGITRGMSDVNHPFSPDILHAYIHSGFYTPVERDLTAAWDNGQPLFERIWP